MSRTERLIQVPSVTLNKITAEIIGNEIFSLGEEKVVIEAEKRARTFFNSSREIALKLYPDAVTEDAFAQRARTDHNFTNLLSKEQGATFTFLSSSGAFRFTWLEFDFIDIPVDVDEVQARADGDLNKFISLKVKARFSDYNDIENRANRQIVVHGENKDWVYAVNERITESLRPQTNVIRNFVYRTARLWHWLTFTMLLLLQYQVWKILFPGFALSTPLTGWGSIFVFCLLVLDMQLSAQIIVRWFGIVYPYLEFEDRTSRKIKGYRTAFAATVAALYSTALISTVKYLIGTKH